MPAKKPTTTEIEIPKTDAQKDDRIIKLGTEIGILENKLERKNEQIKRLEETLTEDTPQLLSEVIGSTLPEKVWEQVMIGATMSLWSKNMPILHSDAQIRMHMNTALNVADIAKEMATNYERKATEKKADEGNDPVKALMTGT